MVLCDKTIRIRILKIEKRRPGVSSLFLMSEHKKQTWGNYPLRLFKLLMITYYLFCITNIYVKKPSSQIFLFQLKQTECNFETS